jgi:hypothetical protein
MDTPMSERAMDLPTGVFLALFVRHIEEAQTEPSGER